jgi:hypothetical protein
MTSQSLKSLLSDNNNLLGDISNNILDSNTLINSGNSTLISMDGKINGTNTFLQIIDTNILDNRKSILTNERDTTTQDYYRTACMKGYSEITGNTETEIGMNNGIIRNIGLSGLQLQVFSDSVNDNNVGSGANTIDLFGIDSNGDDISVAGISLNGLTPVNIGSSGQFYKIHYIRINLVGASKSNEGTITLSDSVSSNIYAIIRPNENISLRSFLNLSHGSVLTINQKRVYLRDLIININSDSSEDLDLRLQYKTELYATDNAIWYTIYKHKKTDTIGGNYTIKVDLSTSEVIPILNNNVIQLRLLGLKGGNEGQYNIDFSLSVLYN